MSAAMGGIEMKTKILNWLPMVCYLCLGMGQSLQATDELSLAEYRPGVFHPGSEIFRLAREFA